MQTQHLREQQQANLELLREQQRNAAQCAQYEAEVRFLRAQTAQIQVGV